MPLSTQSRKFKQRIDLRDKIGKRGSASLPGSVGNCLVRVGKRGTASTEALDRSRRNVQDGSMGEYLETSGAGGDALGGLQPIAAARVASRAIRAGWCPEQRQALVQAFYGLAMEDGRPIRDRSACARVLATLERNEIMAERNAIQESGHELAAQTDRLRAALSDPVARAALASLASAGQQGTPANARVLENLPSESTARENMGPETTQAAPESQVRLEVATDWASAGGADDD